MDSCATMTRRSVHIRYRGEFRDQNQDVCIYFSETLLCFHTGPEPLCSGDQVLGLQAPTTMSDADARVSKLGTSPTRTVQQTSS